MISNIEFDKLDLENGFVHVPGKHAALSQKILSDTMDHDKKTGLRTRLLRIEPGFQNLERHDHPFWEELLILKGSLYEGPQGQGEKKHEAPSFARREPGHMHGPTRTDELCLILEVNWYDDASKSKGA